MTFTARDRYLFRAYGLAPEDYQRALDAQHGRCALCGRRPRRGARLVVDECPVTGEIRGLLHRACNGAVPDRITRYVLDPPLRRFGWSVSPERLAARKRRATEARRRNVSASLPPASRPPKGALLADDRSRQARR